MSLTPEQLAERNTGIGGSDVAAAVGVSVWKSPYQLYLEKRGEMPPFEGNEATLWGDLLEPSVRQQYAERTGRVVRLPERALRHPKYDFMLCHPDGVTDDGRLYEGKATTVADGWGEPETDQVPEEYLLQVQHNMLVTSAATGKQIEVADVAVLIAHYGWHWYRYEVPADPELQEMLIDEEHSFWVRVKTGDPPPIETPQDVRLAYGRASKEGIVHATAEHVAAVRRLAQLKADVKGHEAEIDALEHQLRLAFGPLDTLVHGGKVLATYRAQNGRAGADQEALKRLLTAHTAFAQKHPRLAKKFFMADGRHICEDVLRVGQPFRVLRLNRKHVQALLESMGSDKLSREAAREARDSEDREAALLGAAPTPPSPDQEPFR